MKIQELQTLYALHPKVGALAKALGEKLMKTVLIKEVMKEAVEN